VIFTSVILLFYSRITSSYVLSNTGLLSFVKAIQDNSIGRSFNQLEIFFEHALVLHPDNLSARRGAGFINWYNARDLQAFEEWQYAGLTVHNYVRFGQLANSVTESLRWYNLAEKLEPDNAELWFYVGQICQREPSVEPICDRFFIRNKFNWLVDSEFAFDLLSWHFNRREGADYAFTSCPDVPTKKCATVRIDTVTSPHGASWQQCLTLEAGRTYRYSVWIKAETNGKWIPLYYQGAVKGAPSGYSVRGSYVGSQGWTYWEHDLIAPEFDSNRACFHPVRLLDRGQVWFHSPTLKLVQ
jgi:hypothetical protein